MRVARNTADNLREIEVQHFVYNCGKALGIISFNHAGICKSADKLCYRFDQLVDGATNLCIYFFAVEFGKIYINFAVVFAVLVISGQL